MKKFAIFLFTFLPFLLCAQVETSLNIGSGFSYFAGSGTEKYALINYRGDFMEERYGRTPGLSYHFSIDFKYEPKADFFYGLGMSYDLSRSVIKIRSFRDSFSDEKPLVPEDKVVLLMHNIGLAPFIGQRITKKNYVFDIRFKAEFIRPLYVVDKSKFTLPNHVEVSVNNPRNLDLFDFRLCSQVNVFYKRAGWFVSYSIGFIDYEQNKYIRNITINNNYVASRQIRLGYSYRFIRNN
ncbi:MAG: hypothetical protein ACXWEY_05230 [Bacteroidia bacterium]